MLANLVKLVFFYKLQPQSVRCIDIKALFLASLGRLKTKVLHYLVVRESINIFLLKLLQKKSCVV